MAYRVIWRRNDEFEPVIKILEENKKKENIREQ